jgi:membrane dipeptidase
MIDRRSVLAAAPLLGLSGTAALAAGRAPGAGPILINSLGEIDDSYAPTTAKIASATGTAQAHASGLTAVNITVSVSKDFAEAVQAVKDYDAFVAAHGADYLKVLSVADIHRAKAQGKIGLIFGFQNAAMMGDKAERADTFADMGVKIIQLTYNDLNPLGGGSLVPGRVGLTPFGHAVVERLNARKVMVDLSHSGQQICLDAARASKQPICISHTACAALVANPRNKTDEELRLVAEKGGYVGIFFMPYLNPGKPFSSEDVANHIDHAIQVCGEDHVGIGSDHGINDLGGDMAAVRAHYGKMVMDRRAQGISVAGEDPALLPYGTDLVGPNQFRVVAGRLKARGYSQARIDKIMGGNFLRYAGEIWGA